MKYVCYRTLKIFFGALATLLFCLIQFPTASDSIWFPPPHMIVTGITHGYDPSIAMSFHSSNPASSFTIASDRVNPWRSTVVVCGVWRPNLRREEGFVILYKCSTSPTWIVKVDFPAFLPTPFIMGGWNTGRRLSLLPCDSRVLSLLGWRSKFRAVNYSLIVLNWALASSNNRVSASECNILHASS